MIVVIDYGMGNTGSVLNALRFLGASARLSRAPEDLAAATHLILPGVGAFQDGMRNLREYGLIPALKKEVLSKRKPLLGICLGLQLLAERGEEGGPCDGLGFVKGTVRRLRVDTARFRLPHIGWNDVVALKDTRLFAGIASPVFYFVHSYVLGPTDESVVAATCLYGERFTAAIEQENIFGTQFHPEKSQTSGLAALKNFLAYA